MLLINSRLSELPSTLERQQQQQSSASSGAVSSLATVNNNNLSENKAEEEKVESGDASAVGLDNAGLDSILMPRLAAAQGDTGKTRISNLRPRECVIEDTCVSSLAQSPRSRC